MDTHTKSLGREIADGLFARHQPPNGLKAGLQVPYCPHGNILGDDKTFFNRKQLRIYRHECIKKAICITMKQVKETIAEMGATSLRISRKSD